MISETFSVISIIIKFFKNIQKLQLLGRSKSCLGICIQNISVLFSNLNQLKVATSSKWQPEQQGLSNENKIVPIFLYHRIYDLYTQVSENPNLQPNWPSHFDQQSLPSLPYLVFQVGLPGQRLLAKMGWPIWLQIWIIIHLGVEVIYPVIQKNWNKLIFV